MKSPKQPKTPTPKLCEDIKALNGKSSRNLERCLNDLHILLDEPHEKNNNTDPAPAPVTE